ncbi:MAG: hypothetical protein IIX57_04560 [Lachnospiraceae bacterium]|nr:hypothetical protein [Lachnospiraceae bacterium]
MLIEPGVKLYRYTIRNGKFKCQDGVVDEVNGRMRVIFDGGASSARCPKDNDIGIVRHVGPSLWLCEKDDELAKQIYLDYEKHRLISLRRQIGKHAEIMNMLKSEMGLE